MPNHVKNVVKFNKLKSGDVELLLNMLATKLEDPDVPDREDYIMDFNKIIPEPEDESECPEDCKVNKDSHCEILKDREWFDWYTWRIKYWGTKWGAYDGYVKIGKSYITFVFSTAWSFPYPVIQKLGILGFNIDMKYADEDLGHNCGMITYSREQGWNHYEDVDLVNPYRFAKTLWSKY